MFRFRGLEPRPICRSAESFRPEITTSDTRSWLSVSFDPFVFVVVVALAVVVIILDVVVVVVDVAVVVVVVVVVVDLDVDADVAVVVVTVDVVVVVAVVVVIPVVFDAEVDVDVVVDFVVILVITIEIALFNGLASPYFFSSHYAPTIISYVLYFLFCRHCVICMQLEPAQVLRSEILKNTYDRQQELNGIHFELDLFVLKVNHQRDILSLPGRLFADPCRT